MSDTPTRTIGEVIGSWVFQPLVVNGICAALDLDPAAPADRVTVLQPDQAVVEDVTSYGHRGYGERVMATVVRHVPAEEAT